MMVAVPPGTVTFFTGRLGSEDGGEIKFIRVMEQAEQRPPKQGDVYEENCAARDHGRSLGLGVPGAGLCQ